jgi:hypothetical protein
MLRSQKVREVLEAQEAIPGSTTPVEMDAFLKAEISKWATLIRERNINRAAQFENPCERVARFTWALDLQQAIGHRAFEHDGCTKAFDVGVRQSSLAAQVQGLFVAMQAAQRNGDLIHEVPGPALRTAPHGTARHGTARHGTARHGTARHGTPGSCKLQAALGGIECFVMAPAPGCHAKLEQEARWSVAGRSGQSARSMRSILRLTAATSSSASEDAIARRNGAR